MKVGLLAKSEYITKLSWYIESLKKEGLVSGWYDEKTIDAFAKDLDYPSIRDFYEWDEKEVAEEFNKFLETYEEVEENDEEMEVSDSRKIKDEEEVQNVLDGILMIAFNDGSEEEGYNEVKKHANEQGELDGVQYETYDVDNQDGVTLIDLCAATDDANAFVKALLTEWGIIDAVADIEFEKSELMENAEEGGEEEQVSDSLKTALAKGALKLLSSKIGKWAVKEVGKYLLEKGFEKLTGKSDDDKEVYESEDGDEIEVSYKDGKLDKVSDSKVEDMTKPSHLRGYAEKYRKKRQEQKESDKENEEETQDKEVADSKTNKNHKTMGRVKDDALQTFEINGFIGEPSVAGDYYKLTYGSETIYQDSANEDCYDEDFAYAFFEELLNEIGEQGQLAIKSAIDNGFKVSNTNSIESVWEDACDYLVDNTEHTMEYCELRSTGRSQRYDFGEYWEDGEIFDFNWHYKESDHVLFRQEGNDFVWVNWFDIPMDGEPDRSNYGFVFDTIVYDGEAIDLYDMFV